MVTAPDGTVRTGICLCGCGLPTKVARTTNSAEGRFKGVPNLWLHGHGARGPRARNWNGGRTMAGTKSRYVHVRDPSHPRANARGYVPEHILVVERILGRPLPPHAVIHHIDEDPTNNSPENLVICNDLSHHRTLHVHMRAYRACGHSNWLMCRFCKRWEPPDALHVRSYVDGRGYVFKAVQHVECARQYESERWHRRNNQAAGRTT